MNREQVEEHIALHYNADGEHPWMKDPSSTVYRHQNNRKWFALVMDVPKRTLGLDENGRVDILNVKCDMRLIGSLRSKKGFYPAYHMNKENWITIALDGSADAEELRWLLDMSYELTLPKIKLR